MQPKDRSSDSDSSASEARQEAEERRRGGSGAAWAERLGQSKKRRQPSQSSGPGERDATGGAHRSAAESAPSRAPQQRAGGERRIGASRTRDCNAHVPFKRGAVANAHAAAVERSAALISPPCCRAQISHHEPSTATIATRIRWNTAACIHSRRAAADSAAATSAVSLRLVVRFHLSSSVRVFPALVAAQARPRRGKSIRRDAIVAECHRRASVDADAESRRGRCGVAAA